MRGSNLKKKYSPRSIKLGSNPTGLFFVITQQKFPNFSKTFENQKFPRWLTNSQKHKHQLIKNLILRHNHPCQDTR